MNSLALLAMNMIQNRPEIMNDPSKKPLIDALRSGDDANGERIAMELCKQHGDTPETAMTRVRQFFTKK